MHSPSKPLPVWYATNKEVTWGSVKTFHANTEYTVSILIAIKDGVDIKVKADKGALVSALANGSAKCSKVTITGKISVSGNETAGTDGGDYEIFGFCQNGTFTNCTNKANITSSCRVKYYYESRAAGIANFGTFKNCKNTGTISVTGYMPSLESLYAAGISMIGTLTGCNKIKKRKCCDGRQ